MSKCKKKTKKTLQMTMKSRNRQLIDLFIEADFRAFVSGELFFISFVHTTSDHGACGWNAVQLCELVASRGCIIKTGYLTGNKAAV